MSGTHRSTMRRPAASVLKSAAWLLTMAAVLLALPALLAFSIYLAVAHPADARLLAIAMQSACLTAILGHLTWVVFRERAQSPARLMSLIGEGLLLLCAAMALLSEVGDRLGWTHGPFRYAMTGVDGLLLLAIGAYWLVGRRRLSAALEGRAAAPERVKLLSDVGAVGAQCRLPYALHGYQ
jgi:hypothetical protein